MGVVSTVRDRQSSFAALFDRDTAYPITKRSDMPRRRISSLSATRTRKSPAAPPVCARSTYSLASLRLMFSASRTDLMASTLVLRPEFMSRILSPLRLITCPIARL